MSTVYLLTLRQLLRQPHLWYLMLFALLAIEISPAWAEVYAFGRSEVAVIDTLQATFFVIVLLSVVTSSYSLLGRELGHRIAMTLFTKPIEFHSVLYAKYLALLTSLLFVCLFLGLWMLKQAWYLDWQFIGIKLAFYSMICIFFQGMMILSLSIAWSVSVGPLFSVLLTMLMTFAGYFMPIQYLKYICFFVPATPWFELSTPIAKMEDVPLSFMLFMVLYSVCFSALMIHLSKIFLSRKEF